MFTNKLYSKVYRLNETIISEIMDIPEIPANSAFCPKHAQKKLEK